jgi:PhoPQ-activated pathogenicity-related protein
MRTPSRRWLSGKMFGVGAIVASLASMRPACLAASTGDALADYVHAPDTAFAWEKTEERRVQGLSVIRLGLTSQVWRGNTWRHQMLVVRPGQVRNPDTAFLFITGDGDVTKEFSMLRMLALRAGAIAGVVNRVPNQPLYGGRKEDALIAFTFDQYLKTGDRTWPLLFPMVKTAVRAMDTEQALAHQQFGQTLQRFVVCGASKRGWTTWLTGAVDGRVKAIAPAVIEMLNMKVQAHWAKEMWGGQSDQIKDYTDLRIIQRMDDPRMVELRQWVDPYSYCTRYTMPKLLLLGTNDPYWVVDALRNYWPALPEPKLVFQTPNAGHDLAGGAEAKQTLAAFFQMVADRRPLPRMTWQFQTNHTHSAEISVSVEPPAQAFLLWTSESKDRDFRNDKWSSKPLQAHGGTNVIARIETPSHGFRAYMVEADMVSPTGDPYRLSTEVRVTPDGPPAKTPPTADR